MDIVSASDGSVPSKEPVQGATGERQRRLPGWQLSMRAAIRDGGELCRRLGLGELAVESSQATAGFSVFVPLEFLARMRPGDREDPLLLQVLPVAAEMQTTPGFDLDPVGDRLATLRPGLVQKYAGRALLIVTGACAVHCRYCFRRHFPYSDTPNSIVDWQPALDTIAADDSIGEVLFSGGDPLTVVDWRLSQLATSVAQISHVRRLRIHTRLPIMIPSRVNDELLDWLSGTRLRPYLVVHANHPREIDPSVTAALRRLVDAGIPVLNQSVLLRGVNDRAGVLASLSERLLDAGVIPYYLHQLDRVEGAAHFEVPVDQGKRIVASLRQRLPGYGVPQYVREVTGQPNKVPIV